MVNLFEIAAGAVELFEPLLGGFANGVEQRVVALLQFDQLAYGGVELFFLPDTGWPEFLPLVLRGIGKIREAFLEILQRFLAGGQETPVAGLNGLAFGFGKAAPFHIGFVEFVIGAHEN